MVTKPAKPAVAHLFPSDGAVDDLAIDYPSSDGEPMAESDHQYIPLTNTVSALRVRYHHRNDVYIAGDLLVYYRMNRTDVRVAPDVFAVFGATGNHRRDSWLVWREGKAPDFVMEIASRRTWQRDIDEKRPIYAAMGVREYVRFDPTGRYFTPALVVERLDTAGIYREQPLATDSDGVQRGYSAVLELEFCVLPGLELRLHDPATGEWLLTHQEAEDARRAEAADRQSAEAENARLREQLRLLQQRP